VVGKVFAPVVTMVWREPLTLVKKISKFFAVIKITRRCWGEGAGFGIVRWLARVDRR
jgi:hypothetical protein